MSDIRRTYRNQKQGADFFPWEISISVKLVTPPLLPAATLYHFSN